MGTGAHVRLEPGTARQVVNKGSEDLLVFIYGAPPERGNVDFLDSAIYAAAGREPAENMTAPGAAAAARALAVDPLTATSTTSPAPAGGNGEPILHTLAAEVAEYERLGELAEALPTRARVSEAALPVVLAALYEQLERPLLCLLPEDADARDAAEAAAWFLGDDVVGYLPSRGVRWESGARTAAPPRRRARPCPRRPGPRWARLRVGVALAEGLPPVEARPVPIELAPGGELGVDGLAEVLALAGYERVERVEERGQFAVRGGIVDVFPTTGRDPLRIEFFGDEVESIRAFSPFTQRALHPIDEASIFPAAERGLDLVEPWLGEEGEIRPASDRPRAVARPRAGPRLAARRCSPRLGRGA